MNRNDLLPTRATSKQGQLIRNIADLVLSGRLPPGAEIDTEAAAMARFGVSRVTVRAAYEHLKKMGIIERDQGRTGRIRPEAPAILQSLLAGMDEPLVPNHHEHRNTVIGVMLPEVQTFFPRVLSGIEKAATEYGITVNFGLTPTVERETVHIDRLLSAGVHGMIANPIRYKGNYSLENYLRIQKSGLPFIMIGKPPILVHCDAVYCDDVIGSRNAVRTMFERGCDEVLHITSSLCDEESVQERSEGFRLAVAEARPAHRPVILDYSEADFASSLAVRISSARGRLGVFLYDDLMAPIIYDVVARTGRQIPNDVAIIGYNNLDICDSLPVRMASIRHPQEDLGARAVAILAAKIESRVKETPDRTVHHEIMMPILKERESLPR